MSRVPQLVIKRFQRGVSTLEYAVLAGLIILAVAGAIAAFTPGLSTLFTTLITTATTKQAGH